MSLALVRRAAAPVRFHQLKKIGRSPAHFLVSSEKSTSQLDKGTALHAVLLKGKRVTFYPEVTKIGNAAPRNGEKWEAFRAENADATILTRDEYEQTMAMAAALRANTRAMEVLKGRVEETILFDYLGRPCRTTPDVRGYDFVTELKTTRSAHPRDFRFQALGYRYHAQVAFHALGMELAGIGRPDWCYLVAVESSAPYPVSVNPLTPRALDAGRRLIDEWMARLLACEHTGKFPGYQEQAFDVTEEDDRRYGADVQD